MTNMALNPEMGASVIKHLKQFGDLPRRGLVAGQAVASAISELHGDGRAVVYNDVDVFTRANDKDRHRVKMLRQGQSESAIATLDFLSDMDGYGNSAYKLQDRHVAYSVVKSIRDGMVNQVVCERSDTSDFEMLRSFDMNNVQVGVNLETQKLVWTPAFADFLHTHQLEITRLHTPMHSLIRYFRKKEELAGVYGNDERMIEMVAAAHELIRAPGIANGGWDRGDWNTRRLNYIAQWRMGNRYQAKLAEVSSLVLPHFEESQETINGYTVSELTPRFNVEKDLLQVDVINFLNELPVVSKALREKHTKGMSERLQYLLSKKSESSSLHRLWCIEGHTFVRGNVSPSEMARADKVLNEHPLTGAVVRQDLAEVNRRVKLIKEQANKRGSWVFGYFMWMHQLEWTPQGVADLLDAYMDRLSQLKVKSLFGKMVIDGYDVCELTNGYELLVEGSNMHHCVGGYAEEYSKDSMRVFSLRKPNSHPSTWLTVMLSRPGANQVAWKLAECKGLANRPLDDSEYPTVRHMHHRFAMTCLLGKKLASVLPILSLETERKLQKVARDAWKFKHSYLTVGSWSERIAIALCPKGVDATEFTYSCGVSARYHVRTFWKKTARNYFFASKEERTAFVARLRSLTPMRSNMSDIPF